MLNEAIAYIECIIQFKWTPISYHLFVLLFLFSILFRSWYTSSVFVFVQCAIMWNGRAIDSKAFPIKWLKQTSIHTFSFFLNESIWVFFPSGNRLQVKNLKLYQLEQAVRVCVCAQLWTPWILQNVNAFEWNCFCAQSNKKKLIGTSIQNVSECV